MRKLQHISKPQRMRNIIRKAGVLLCLAAAFSVQSAGALRKAYAAEGIQAVRVEFTSTETDADGLPVITGETTSDRYTVNRVEILEEYEATREFDDDDDDDSSGSVLSGTAGYVNAGPGSSTQNQGTGGIYDDDDAAENSAAAGTDRTIARDVYGTTTVDPMTIDTLISRNYKNSGLLAYNQTYRSMGNLSELVYVAELEAANGYAFTLDSSKIRLSGLGASYVKHERENSRTRLVIYLKFSGLAQQAVQISSAGWEDNGQGSQQVSGQGRGIAAWTATGNGALYELRLLRGGRTIASGKKTAALAYDFRPFMTRAGEYSYMIRPVLELKNKAEWIQSDSIILTEEEASVNKSLYNGSGTGWREASGRYWYREADGAYIQANWLQDAGNWYYFDASGWMQTDSFVEWKGESYYLDAQGHMLTGAKAPDGRIAGESGALSWPMN
ncbi:MAG: hypothetical protein Q4C63_07905 [Eubacteriales bacterium]|nr:hypothetical protein [Eubacteriales bacterium]